MKIAIIIGSVRQNRVSDKLAHWINNELKNSAQTEIIDLKDYDLPFMEEPISPRYNPSRNPSPNVKKWLDKISEFDGYVIVTPEYNRSTSAVLKNAIDHLDYQMEDKPVALVGHGSNGGAQAISTLRAVLPQVGAITVPPVVYFSNKVDESIDKDGVLNNELIENPYGPQSSLVKLVESLSEYTTALLQMRN